MAKNEKTSSLDYTNSITSAHVESEQAFNVINVNSLIPPNHGKISLEYITIGNGTGQVGRVDYYSKAVCQQTKVVCKGDALGSAHKTTINFVNRTPESLAGKGFVIYDNIGAVTVWFNLDFGNSAPANPESYRSIEVNILSSYNHEVIAQKTALALSIDPKFLAVYSLYYVIISSSSSGIRPDSYDLTTNLFIRNTSGTQPESLNNKYFYINSANNETSYYVWYNANGAGVDPLVPSKTGIMVAISSGSSASTVAQKTKEQLDLTNDFLTNIDNDSLLITNKLIGITAEADEQNTGFLVFTQTLGEDRTLISTLLLEYDTEDNLVSVERL